MNLMRWDGCTIELIFDTSNPFPEVQPLTGAFVEFNGKRLEVTHLLPKCNGGNVYDYLSYYGFYDEYDTWKMYKNVCKDIQGTLPEGLTINRFEDELSAEGMFFVEVCEATDMSDEATAMFRPLSISGIFDWATMSFQQLHRVFSENPPKFLFNNI